MLQLMLHHRNTQSFRPLSGSYISQYFISCVCLLFIFVSVPYRGATFLNCNNKKAWSWHAGERFPSPIGELHFSIVILLSSVPLMIICFRPLSGSYISQQVSMEYLTLVKMFPSPIGELHFSITTHNIEDYWNNLFPSPIGELHFSMCYYFSLCYLLLVSVPYRGATFLN